jgi:hypothetical protein
MQNKFYTKRGFLTDYTLSCGYIEVSKQYHIRMFKEHGVYHVKCKQQWEVFSNLVLARKCFIGMCKENKTSRIINKGK